MSQEQTANFAYTTVAVGGYTAGSGVLNVASTSTGSGLQAFPSSGTFSVSLVDQGTLLPKALLEVTAINGATQFAVVNNGGVDASANAGDFVFCVQDSRSLTTLLGQIAGAYPPAFASWTQVTFPAGSAANTTNNFLYMQPLAGNWLQLVRAQPTTPYTVTAVFDSLMPNSATGAVPCALGWRESATSKVSGIESFFDTGSNPPQYFWTNRTGNTTFASLNGAAQISPMAGNRRQYLRLQNTGAALRIYTSPDGKNWQQFYIDQAVNSFFTAAPNQILIGCGQFGGAAYFGSCSLISYSEG